MYRPPFFIGAKSYRSKSEAISFYKSILGSYEIDAKLNAQDHDLLFDLRYKDVISEKIELYKAERNEGHEREVLDDAALVKQIRNELQDYLNESGYALISISIELHPEFKNTRCFVFEYEIDGKNYFSYILAINGPISDSRRFSRACRHIVSDRLRKYKEQRFASRPVRCAITNEVVEWEECQIDHKSPLTFSIIVKSFIVANKIDVSSINYVGDITVEKFSDQTLAEKFDEYHKAMAVLRIISTKQNQKLSGQARIKPTIKDNVLT